jgi:hypothetical protein
VALLEHADAKGVGASLAAHGLGRRRCRNTPASARRCDDGGAKTAPRAHALSMTIARRLQQATAQPRRVRTSPL